MAVAAKRRVVVNTGRRPRKRNKPRHMTAKQIKYFGTPAQKARLRHSRHSKRNRPKGGYKSRTKHHAISHRSRPRPKRKNPGDILSLVLGNPARKKGKAHMAAPKKRRRRSSGHHRRNRRRTYRSNPKHHSYTHRRRRRYSANPHRRRTRRHNYSRHRGRNPASRGIGGGLKQNLMFLGAGAVGFFGSKLLTQAVMQDRNTGMAGYIGNAVASGGLALFLSMFRATRKFAGPVLAGGVLQIAFRAMVDKTPFGQLTSKLGVGDYQMQSFVTPQRLKHPLDSAEIEIPPGWAPQIVQSAGVPGGVRGYNRDGGGTYSGGGMYAT